jgi:hypothetical protein
VLATNQGATMGITVRDGCIYWVTGTRASDEVRHVRM